MTALPDRVEQSAEGMPLFANQEYVDYDGQIKKGGLLTVKKPDLSNRYGQQIRN